MDVTSTTRVTKTTSTDQIVSNPNAQLTSDDFMKLFITQLKYQDPTQPMDTDKMLQETSQMTQLKSNQDLSIGLKKLISRLDESREFNSVALIGKTIDTGKNSVILDKNKNDIPFDLYFKDDFIDATIKIEDLNGNIVKEIKIKDGEKGIQHFSWDGTDDNGNKLPEGSYKIIADYTTNDKKQLSTILGQYPVSAVKFENGEAMLKIGENYIPMSSVKEVLG